MMQSTIGVRRSNRSFRPKCRWVSPILPPGDVRLARMAKARVLVVEDDAPLADLFARVLADAQCEPVLVDTRAAALRRLSDGELDVLLTDLHLPDGDGVSLIEEARRIDPRIAIVAVTGFGSIELAVRAVRQGAYEF